MEADQQQQQENDGSGQEGSTRKPLSLLIMFEELTPYAISIFINLTSAGFNIISKVSLDSGMSSYVLLVYSGVFGTLTTALFALLFERKNDLKNFGQLVFLRDLFFLGLFGVLLARLLFYIGLKDTSPTAAAALANLVPSMTFILSVLIRMEPLNIYKRSAQAKVGGTLVALAGATLMILYKGRVLLSPHFAAYHSHHSQTSSSSNKDWVKGSLLILVAYLASSTFFVLQAVTVKKYPAPITLTSLTCLSGTIITAIVAAVFDHKASSWRLSWDLNLVAVLYTGIVVFGLTFYLQLLVARTRGAVFLTAFRPLGTIITILMGLLILGDALFVGSIVGALLIIVGLYITLWGKEKEKARKVQEVTAPTQSESIDVESER